MSELREKILQVKDQKDTYIIPENIRKDVTILGIMGTLEEGIDTSDATATADNIDQGKTAYVNGQKITGTSMKIDTSISSIIIEPEYESTGANPFILNSETGYYEISGPCNGLLEISFTNSITTDITLNYKGNKLTSDASYTDIELDGELVEGLGSTTDYEDVVIEDVTPGDHTITVKITSEYNTTNLSIKMLSINIPGNPITVNTVLDGYSGYVNGQKVTGTYVPLDTSDATATSADIATGKTAYVNGVKVTGIGAMTFATVAEMNAITNVPEDTLAIVYGTDYVGTYRFDNGSWTEIGSKSVEQQSMDNLNALDGSTDQYEGLGGTEEQVNEVLDEIIEGSQEESGTTNGKHSGD